MMHSYLVWIYVLTGQLSPRVPFSYLALQSIAGLLRNQILELDMVELGLAKYLYIFVQNVGV